MTVLYLLDANVFIDANRDYYPIERVPEFWDWLTEMGELGAIKTPQEIYEEIVLPLSAQRDPLVEWLRTHRDAVLLYEEVKIGLVGNVTEQGYADDLTEDEVEKIGRDPFLIAYALADASERCVVTNERSRPSRTRANRHLPDVCQDLHVLCRNTFELIQDLDFRTSRGTRP